MIIYILQRYGQTVFQVIYLIRPLFKISRIYNPYKLKQDVSYFILIRFIIYIEGINILFPVIIRQDAPDYIVYAVFFVLSAFFYIDIFHCIPFRLSDYFLIRSDSFFP